MTIQVKAIEQYFPVVLFIMLYKVVLTFEPVDEILKFNSPYKLISLYFKVNTDKSMLQTNLMLYRLSSVAEPEESQRSSFLGPESLQFSIS